MNKMITLSETELIMAFTASCIESTARRLKVSYKEVYAKLKTLGIIDGYIIPCYDILHTESREHVTDNIIECMEKWEESIPAKQSNMFAKSGHYRQISYL